MKTTLVSSLAAGSVAAVLVMSPASAITFTTSSVSVADSINGPNVAYSSNGLNSNLTIGSPFTIADFIHAHVDGTSFSMQSGTISATFNFILPPGASGNVDSGTISAFLVQTARHISITWADPITVLFSDGTQLSVDLGDIDFNCGLSCNQKDFDIAGTFTALSGPTVVSDASIAATTPVPGALPLFSSAGGLLAYMGWRKKRKAGRAAANQR